jgi:O-antigen ligase
MIKNFNKNKIDQVFSSLLIILSFVNISIIPVFGPNTFSSLLFSAIFIVVYFWAIGRLILWLVKNKMPPKERCSDFHHQIPLLWFLFLAITFFASLNVINGLTSTNFSFSFFKKLIISLTVLLSMGLFSTSTLGKSYIRILTWLSIFSSLVFLCAFLAITIKEKTSGTQSNFLYLNFSNPNEAGMTVVVVCACLFYSFFISNSFLLKGLITFCFLGNCFLIYKTSSRNCFFSIALSFLVALYLFRVKRSKSPSKTAIFSLIVEPWFLACIYLLLSNFKIGSGLFQLEGKSADSRVSIWENSLYDLIASPFLGAYSKEYFYGDIAQLHNSHLDFLVNFGLIPFFLFIAFLFCCVWGKLEKSKFSKIQKAALVSFCSVFFLGNFETALFFAVNGIFVIGFSFLSLFDSAASTSEEKEQNEKERLFPCNKFSSDVFLFKDEAPSIDLNSILTLSPFAYPVFFTNKEPIYSRSIIINAPIFLSNKKIKEFFLWIQVKENLRDYPPKSIVIDCDSAFLVKKLYLFSKGTIPIALIETGSFKFEASAFYKKVQPTIVIISNGFNETKARNDKLHWIYQTPEEREQLVAFFIKTRC